LIGELISKARRALACWQRGQEHRRTELRAAARALPAADELLAVPRQRLDACAERLPRALIANAQMHHRQLTRIAARLSPRLLRTRLTRAGEIVAAFSERRARATRVYLDRRAQRLRSAGQLLAAFSYRGVLARGFALVRDGAGHPLRSAAAVAGGMRLAIEFADGRVAATADGGAPAKTEPKPEPKADPKPRPRGGSGGQGTLF
jgi:exodeoxyribonuclease VII large subunit